MERHSKNSVGHFEPSSWITLFGSSLLSVGNLIRQVQPRSAALRRLQVESGINCILPVGGGPCHLFRFSLEPASLRSERRRFELPVINKLQLPTQNSGEAVILTSRLGKGPGNLRKKVKNVIDSDLYSSRLTATNQGYAEVTGNMGKFCFTPVLFMGRIAAQFPQNPTNYQ
jgi:hypothetical protein